MSSTPSTLSTPPPNGSPLPRGQERPGRPARRRRRLARWGIAAAALFLAVIAVIGTAVLTIGSWVPRILPGLSERRLGARIEVDSLGVFPLGSVRAAGLRVFRIGADSPAIRADKAEATYDGVDGLLALRPRGVFVSGLEIDAVESRLLAADLAERRELPTTPTKTVSPLAREKTGEDESSWTDALQGRLPSEVRIAGLRLTGLGDPGAVYGLRDFATSQTRLSSGETLFRVGLETEPLDTMFKIDLSQPFRLSAACRIGRGSFSVEKIETNIESLVQSQSGEGVGRAAGKERSLSLTAASGGMGRSQRLSLGGAVLGGRWNLAAEREGKRDAGTAPRTSATLTVADVSLPKLGRALRGFGAGSGLGLEGSLSSRVVLDYVDLGREATTVTLEAADLRFLPAGGDGFPVRPVDVRAVLFGSTRLGDPSAAPVLRGRFEADRNLAVEIEEVVLPHAGETQIVVRQKARVSDLRRLIELLPGVALPIPVEEPIAIDFDARIAFRRRGAASESDPSSATVVFVDANRVYAVLSGEAAVLGSGRAEFVSSDGGFALRAGAGGFGLKLSDLSRTAERLGIDGLTIEGTGDLADGKVRFEDGATTATARFSLDSPSGQAPRAAAVWDGLDARGDLSVSVRDTHSSPSIATRGDFSLRELAGAGVRLREAAGTWKSVDREIDCEVDRASLCLGEVRATARASLAAWPPDVESSGTVSALDLGVFGQEFDMAGARLAGRVDAEWRGRYGPGGKIEFDAEVESAAGQIEIDKATVRKLLSQLPGGVGWLMAGDPIKTLDRKFKDRAMVPFDEFKIDSRYAEDRIANRLALENEHFRIVLDANVDLPVVIEFLRLRQEAAAGNVR